MDQKAQQDPHRYYGGWLGWVPRPSPKDYHVGGDRLPLEELAAAVVEDRARKSARA